MLTTTTEGGTTSSVSHRPQGNHTPRHRHSTPHQRSTSKRGREHTTLHSPRDAHTVATQHFITRKRQRGSAPCTREVQREAVAGAAAAHAGQEHLHGHGARRHGRHADLGLRARVELVHVERIVALLALLVLLGGSHPGEGRCRTYARTLYPKSVPYRDSSYPSMSKRAREDSDASASKKAVRARLVL